MTLSDSDIATLNAARTILDNLSVEVAMTAAEGRLSEAASRGENAIFRVLNVATHHVHVTMTEDQLHNREPIVRDPDAWAAVAKAGRS